MKSCVAVLVLIIVFSWAVGGAPAADRADTPLSDDRIIQGEWTVVSIDDGAKGHLEWLKGKGIGTVLMVKEDGVALKGEEPGVRIKLDPSRSPKEINLYVGDLAYPGIYQLDEKSLKICLANHTGDARPTKLEAKEGGAWLYVVLKRPMQ